MLVPLGAGSASNVWLSSSNPANANNERNGTTTGSLTNNNGQNANAVVPRLWDSE